MGIDGFTPKKKAAPYERLFCAAAREVLLGFKQLISDFFNSFGKFLVHLLNDFSRKLAIRRRIVFNDFQFEFAVFFYYPPGR